MKSVDWQKNKPENKERIEICTLGITARMAIFLVIFLFVPMAATGVFIEKGWLLPGENFYLAVPLFFVCLIVPFSRWIAHHLINKDLLAIARFCEAVKKGDYSVWFNLSNQKENEDPFVTLLRNLTWMSHHISHREERIRNRINQISSDYSKLEKVALTDPLTGLFNRRYLEELAAVWGEHEVSQQVSLIYIDCDHFKTVNDTLGHSIGDELLVWLAECLTMACRLNHDIPIRMGGDEFAIILPGADVRQAKSVGERIRTLFHSELTHNTTLSIGISYVTGVEPEDGLPIDLLLKCADEQAYVVKQAGGNNVCIDNVIHLDSHRGKKERGKIHELANFDPLTGLPNRYLAKERFQVLLKRTLHSGNKFCLMFLDLDDFKTINESLGHHVGDECLKRLTECLKNLLKAEDSICRLGGDEFLIMTENITCREDVTALALKIIEAVKLPMEIDGSQIVSTASMGITLVPDDGKDFDGLCRKTDIALFKAKEKGRNNFHFFNEKMGNLVVESSKLVSELRSAITKDQMELYFQPQISLHNGEICGAESLIRWNHPQKGILSPVLFIPLAERSGQIIEMGEWVIDQACRMCAQWNRGKEMVVAINISPLQITRGTIADTVLSAMKRYGVPGKLIELEFTESLFLQNTSEIKEDLAKLRAVDVRFAIDDFGTGYSNLNYLKDFEITKLKIDRSFIGSMTSSKQDQAIVTAIIQMAQSLNIETVAEGIEDEHTMALLQSLGCDTGQGYYWAKPGPEKQFYSYCHDFDQDVVV